MADSSKDPKKPAAQKGGDPSPLEDLVSDGYLRSLPVDPMTGTNSTWVKIMEDPNNSASQNEPGIFDVRSGSDKTSLDGTPYADW